MLTDLIPDPEKIHARLREVLHEAAVLRRLFRVAVRARDEGQKERKTTKGATNQRVTKAKERRPST
jgi:hypothetical protein